MLEEGADRPAVLKLIAELRARGVSSETDFAGRSVKGQLTQAGRLGARTTVIVGADGARIRRAGVDDEPAGLEELAARWLMP